MKFLVKCNVLSIEQKILPSDHDLNLRERQKSKWRNLRQRFPPLKHFKNVSKYLLLVMRNCSST